MDRSPSRRGLPVARVVRRNVGRVACNSVVADFIKITAAGLAASSLGALGFGGAGEALAGIGAAVQADGRERDAQHLHLLLSRLRHPDLHPRRSCQECSVGCHPHRGRSGSSGQSRHAVSEGIGALGHRSFARPPQGSQIPRARRKRVQGSLVGVTYCSVACGILIYSLGDRAKNAVSDIIHIEGDPDHPVNRGTLCPKGSALLDIVHAPTRLKVPKYRAPGRERIQGSLLGLRARPHREADEGRPRQELHRQEQGRDDGQPLDLDRHAGGFGRHPTRRPT